MTTAQRYEPAIKLTPEADGETYEVFMREVEPTDPASDEPTYVLAADYDRLLGELKEAREQCGMNAMSHASEHIRAERLKAEHDQAWINHEEIW